MTMLADTRKFVTDGILRFVGILNGGRYRKYRAHGSYIYLDIGESTMMLRRVMQIYEVAKHRFLADNLERGMVFVDVGANKGDFSLLAQRLVGEGGLVIAVEPEPENCHWIKESIAANGYHGIRLVEAALTDGEGEATLYLGEKSGWHTLSPGQAGSCGERRVRTTTLDSLCSDLPRVDVVKIDVQGAESRVLAGASATLSRCRPVVLLDLHPQVDVAAIGRSFDALDYDAFAMTNLACRLDALPEGPAEVCLKPRPA
jgi:FkbM family methyltransferase